MTQTRFTPFPPVSCAYGAPMGRPSADLPEGTPHDRLAVAGPAGEYDSGGAYWGRAAPHDGPVWAVWIKGRGRDGVAYVRAKGRRGAKRAAVPIYCPVCGSGNTEWPRVGEPSDKCLDCGTWFNPA